MKTRNSKSQKQPACKGANHHYVIRESQTSIKDGVTVSTVKSVYCVQCGRVGHVGK